MTSSVTDLCRLCGTDTFNIVRHHIFEAESLAKCIAKKIAECLPVNVTPQDRLPKHMCGECAYKLDLLSEFRDKAVKTEHLLESLVDGVKPEILENEEPDNDLGADDGFRSDSPDQPEPEVLIKEEDAEPRPERRPVRKAARKVGRPRGRKRKQTEIEPDTEEEVESEEAPKKAVKKEEAPPKVYRKRGRKPKNNKESPGNRFHIPTTSSSGRSLRRSAHFAMRSISKFAKLEEKVDRELKLHPPQYPIPDDHKEASAWDNKDECCSVCKLYIGDVESMQEHFRKEHPERLTCNTCKEVQSTVESLKKHIINHKNDYFEKKAKFVPAVMVKLPTGIVVRRQRCTTCNQFVSNLKRHIIVKHTKDYRFGCTECGKKFPLEVDLAKHIKICHQKEFPYLCIECGKGFFSKTLLSAHERRHRGEKFAFCDTCGDGFYSKQLLVTHIQSRHFITSRDHPCEICGKRYKSQTALRLHRKLHFDEFMKFVCNFCGRRFYKMCLLNYHVKRVHTLERPFQCDTCGMGFILRSRMATHAISHMDVKMNQCKFCPNSYRWAHTLNRHMKKAHRDQLAAWMCDLCGEELHSEVSLMNHKAKKHPIPHQFLIAPEEFRKVGGQAETNSSEVFF